MRASSPHDTSHASRPLSADTFNPVPKYCILDTTAAKRVRTMGSGREHLTRCTCARGGNFVYVGKM